MNNPIFRNIYIATITLFLIIVSNSLFSQNSLEVRGKFALKEGSAKEGEIKLYENGTFSESYMADRSGKFKVDLDLNKDYIFEFTKDGYVTKKININTNVPDKYADKYFTPIFFAVELFQQYDEVNTIVFTKPVGLIKFYDKVGDFDYDVDYSTEVRNKIDKAEKELEIAHKKNLEAERQKEIEEKRQQLLAQKAAEEAVRQRKLEEEKAAAEARRKAAEEAARIEAERKAALLAQQQEEAEKRRQEEEARKQAELLEKQRIAEQQKIEAAERAKKEAEEIARQNAANEARLKAEAEALKKAAEEKARIEAEEQAKKLAALKEESEKRRKEDEAEKALQKEQRLAKLTEEKRLSEERKKAEEAAIIQAKLENEERLKRDIEVRKAKALTEILNQAKQVADEFVEVKKDYPKGKTVEDFEKLGMKIKRTIVIDSETVRIYLKVEHDWGAIYYFRNNQCISQELYNVELESI